MKTRSILFLAAATALHVAPSMAARPCTTGASLAPWPDEEALFGEFALLDSRARKTFKQQRFTSKKEGRQFEQRYKRWLQAFRSEALLCRAFGFPEAESELFPRYAEAPGSTQNDFLVGLRNVGTAKEFKQRYQEWQAAESAQADARARLQASLEEIHSRAERFATRLAEAAESPASSRAAPNPQLLGNDFLASAARMHAIGEDWRVHLAEHADCPAADWYRLARPFIESTDGIDAQDIATLARLRDVAEERGAWELALGLAALVCELPAVDHFEDGTGPLEFSWLAARLGPPWSHLAREPVGFLDGAHREEALSLTALIALNQRLGHTTPRERSALHEKESQAVVALEAMNARSARSREVMGLHALLDRRPGDAREHLTAALQRAPSEGVVLGYAAELLPIAHALSAGPAGLEDVLPPQYRGELGRRVLVNLADAWDCVGPVLSVLGSAAAEPWWSRLALRHMRNGELERAARLLDELDPAVQEPSAATRMVHAWLLLDSDDEAGAREAATRAVLANAGDDPAIWRAARIVHANATRLNPFLPDSAEAALEALDAWELELGARPLGAQAERAFVLAAVGRHADAAPLLAAVLDQDPDLAAGTLADLEVFDREHARALAETLGVDLPAEDPRAALRRSADWMNLDDRHVSRGLDGLRVWLEDDSRRHADGRAELFSQARLLVPADEHLDDSDEPSGLLDEPEVRILDAEGNVLAPLEVQPRNGEPFVIQDVAELPLVVYLSGPDAPAKRRLAADVESLNAIASMERMALFLFHGTEEQLEAFLGNVEPAPGVRVATLPREVPKSWQSLLAYPQIVFVDDTGTASRQFDFRAVFEALRAAE